MAKAPSSYPVTLVKTDPATGDTIEREVHQVGSFNQATWEGFEYKDGEAPAGDDQPLTPAQKAAATRKANREARAAGKTVEKPAEKPRDDLSAVESTVGTVESGGTADGESTVGSNPS